MKCKACNGTGYVTACVYESDEIGFVDKNYECAVCHGTGLTEQTNEEWFCNLSTEEKAEWVTKNLSVYADDWVKSDEKLLNPATWVDWLKEIHE